MDNACTLYIDIFGYTLQSIHLFIFYFLLNYRTCSFQVSLYLTLGKLYHTMGLKRKAIFMLLNAGRQAVIMSEYPSKILSKSSPKNPSDSSSKNWSNNLAPQINGNLKEKVAYSCCIQ